MSNWYETREEADRAWALYLKREAEKQERDRNRPHEASMHGGIFGGAATAYDAVTRRQEKV